MLDSKKELTPVFYGDRSVKILPITQAKSEAFCFHMHWHERMELIYVIEGSLLLDLGKGYFCVNSGSIAIISPEQPHCGRASINGVSYYTIMFDLTAFYNNTPFANHLLKPVVEKKVVFTNCTDNEEIIGQIRGIIESRTISDTASILIEEGKIYELIGLLFRHCAIQKPSREVSDKRFSNVLEYINNNFCNDVSSQSLSNIFGYDEAYFCRRFKAITGLPTMVYIRILRLEKSKKLLQNNGLTISQVSASCGFSDAGYFARCFKRYYGIAPVEYRNKIYN